MQTQPRRYDCVSIFLHWLIGIGVILVGLAEMLRGELFARGSAPREILKALHEPVGLVVLVLIVARIAWRIAHKPPAMPADMKPWEVSAAKLTHLALYTLMIIVPVLGLAATAARGRAIDFGFVQIAVPFAVWTDRASRKLITGVHEFASHLMLAIVLLHAAAAIWHHAVRRDDVLTRMLPRTVRKSA